MNRKETEKCINTAVHELKNPLSAIQTTAGLLSVYHRQMTEEDRERHYKRLLDSAADLRKLLDDLTLFSRASLLNSMYENDPGELISAATDAIDCCTSGGDLKNKISISCPDDFRGWIPDKTAVREILSRLLKNAGRTAPPDSALVVRIGQSVDFYFVEVEHTGSGKEPDLTSTDVSKEGLDLSIACLLAKKTGSILSYKTDLINATCFVLSLPVCKI